MHEKLKILAQAVLGNGFNDFQRMFDDLNRLSPKQFTDRHADWIQRLFHPDQAKIDGGDVASWYFTDCRPWFEGEYETATPEQFFLDFAQQCGCFAWVDWSGEDHEGEIAEVVDKMLRRHGHPGFGWDTAAFDEGVDFDALQRGDYVLLLLKAIDKKLRDQNFRLALFQDGSDAYRYTVLSDAGAQGIIGLQWGEFYCVYTPDRIPNGIP